MAAKKTTSRASATPRRGAGKGKSTPRSTPKGSSASGTGRDSATGAIPKALKVSLSPADKTRLGKVWASWPSIHKHLLANADNAPELGKMLTFEMSAGGRKDVNVALRIHNKLNKLRQAAEHAELGVA